MKYFQARKSISMATRRGLLLVLALALLAVAGWLNYRGMVASTDAVTAGRLANVQLAIVALTCLLLLGAFVIVEWQILVRHRRQAEEAVRESEERLGLAIAAANLGTWDRNLITDDLIWSSRCFELFGISPEAHMTYQRFLEAIHPEDRERVDRTVRAAVERHENYEAEMRIARPDAVRYIASRGHAHYDSSGRPTRMTGVIMDITQRRQAEEAIRQSQERLTLAIAAANLGTWDRKLVSDEVIWSARCYELFGISPDTPMTYQRFLEAIHPEDRDRVEEAIRTNVEQHEDHEIEMRVVWPDGTIRHVAERGRAQYDPSGRPTRITGVAMDITQRRQDEEAIRQSQERLSLVISAANLGTWDWNLVSGELAWSPKCLELYGISPGIPMTYQRFLEAVHPEDRDRIDRAVRVAVERHEDYNVELRTAWPDAVPYIATRGRAYYDHSGRPTRMTGVALDITARRRAEDALRAAKEELAHANQDLEEKVRQRTAKLQEAMEELEHMSYSMIHDMRAPLRSMHGFATILEEEYANCLPTEGLGYPRLIRESASRLDQLVTDALNYSKVVRQDFPLTPVEVGSLLRGMIKSYPDLRRSSVLIEIEFDQLMVLGNQSLLTQCFGNLLGNAVKFVATEVKPHVDVRAETMGEMVRIWVEDNGIGIPKDKQDRLFRMFQRMHHENEYPGTGIGLAIVRKAVERMGGNVGLESEPGKGSKFWIELLSPEGAEIKDRLGMQHAA